MLVGREWFDALSKGMDGSMLRRRKRFDAGSKGMVCLVQFCAKRTDSSMLRTIINVTNLTQKSYYCCVISLFHGIWRPDKTMSLCQKMRLLFSLPLVFSPLSSFTVFVFVVFVAVVIIV